MLDPRKSFNGLLEFSCWCWNFFSRTRILFLWCFVAVVNSIVLNAFSNYFCLQCVEDVFSKQRRKKANWKSVRCFRTAFRKGNRPKIFTNGKKNIHTDIIFSLILCFLIFQNECLNPAAFSFEDFLTFYKNLTQRSELEKIFDGL